MHIADVEEEARAIFFQLVDELSEKENVNEKIKAESPMLWVQK